MARRSSPAASGLPPRIQQLLLGAAIGAAWGVVLWVISQFTGSDNGVAALAYVVLVCAMIGGGVAAVFGGNQARKRGERVLPRFRRRR
jgi:hypothetical protein